MMTWIQYGNSSLVEHLSSRRQRAKKFNRHNTIIIIQTYYRTMQHSTLGIPDLGVGLGGCRGNDLVGRCVSGTRLMTSLA